MTSVTVPGPNDTSISANFGNPAAAQLAQQIRDALVSAGANLNITTVSGSQLVPPGQGGTLDELVITGGGDFTIPGGTPPGSSDYVVVLDTTENVTIHGAPNISVFGS